MSKGVPFHGALAYAGTRQLVNAMASRTVPAGGKPVRLATLGVTALLLLAPTTARSDDYANVKTLQEAIEIFKSRLTRDGKQEYVPLVTETNVRDAIRTALQSYEELLDKRKKQRQPGPPVAKDDAKYFQEVLKPIYEEIADRGSWPKGCSFFSFYTLTDRGIEYQGLGLRLRVDTPEKEFKGFALPIIDLYYGRFGR
jgi:hypothetical protein